MKISVIILNYNGISHLKDCLDSLAKQTFNDFETILVDNGSTDNSLTFVSENYPLVQIVPLKKNRGFARGNNIGISHAKGEFIALLNNDTRVDVSWLSELYNAVTSDEQPGFCVSKVLFYDNPEVIDTAGDGISICGAPFKRGHMQSSDMFNEPGYVFGASGCAVLYRKSMLDDTGGLDDDYFAIFEDGDLSFRCQLKGYKCLYVPTAIVYHKVNSTLKKFSNFYVYYGHRNVDYLYIKNMPFSLILKYYHTRIAYTFLAFLYFSWKGKGFVFLKAKFDVFKALPDLLKKRWHIQRNRKVKVGYIDKMLDQKWLSGRIKRKAPKKR